ncbi:MAG: DUF1573 domain-containing protein [Chitinophagales bacterium]
MKTFIKLALIATVLFLSAPFSQASANGENDKSSDEANKAAMVFTAMSHDFGTIEAGEKVSHLFTFTNRSEEPLIINSVKGSCGCTVPEWSKEPVAPGSEGQIEVFFNSKGKFGQQTKTVTIDSNIENQPIILTIKAKIDRAVGDMY